MLTNNKYINMKKLISAVLFAAIILAIVIASIYFRHNKTTKKEVMEPQVKITIIKPGKGDEAVNGAKTTVHYTGWLVNGTKFDSSLDRKTPLTFTLGAKEVIDGWDKGVLGMKVGEIRRLEIPSAMAYGSQDLGVIPPNSDLTFEVELLKVSK